MLSSLRLAIFVFLLLHGGFAYVSPAMKNKWKTEGMNLEKALKTIEECSESRDTKGDELYGAVRFIDRNAHHIYSDPAVKEALWQRAQGSWGA